MGPRDAPDTALLQGDDNRYPPACGEDHKTKDNQLNTSRTNPEESICARRSPGNHKDISQLTELHKTR